MKRIAFACLIAATVCIGMTGCKSYNFRSNYRDANALLHSTENLQTRPFLKAHLKNGDICILQDTWMIDTAAGKVGGVGLRYDFNRQQVENGAITIPFDSVAIFETNTKLQGTETGRISALALLTGLDVSMALLCMYNPKACFGSCPTFYLRENDNFHYADAEGFSNAISPSMEYADIDALDGTESRDSVVSITMKNEALETHCVREVQLLACRRTEGARIFHSTGDKFYRCDTMHAPSQALAGEGNITQLLLHPDRQERFSPSDENNLSSKEEIILTFDAIPDQDEQGLILHFRQTLMTTYFIYNAMGYMGDEVGDIFAKIETNSEIKQKLRNGLKQELGAIGVYLLNADTQSWEFRGEFYETGPIAINRQILPLGKSRSGPATQIKLVLNRGLWRIDHAALARIVEEAAPLNIPPAAIERNGMPDPMALVQLVDPDQHLIIMPGNRFTLTFKIPDDTIGYELFIRSKGYYLEWMRASWLSDKNLMKLRQMVVNPGQYLRDEAQTFRSYETIMERAFWNSKIDREIFSSHEN